MVRKKRKPAKKKVVQVKWSREERQAWKLPKKLTVSEWADANRILDSRTSAEPGQWRTNRTPYLKGIMDAFTDPEVEDITVMASTQTGKTEALYNCIGYLIDQDPGPTLLVMPRDTDADAVSENRVKPMLQESPALKIHLTLRADDLKKKQFSLDRMILYYAGSNSPAALSQKPVRYLFFDETDKYPKFSGREADPIKLATERTRTFWNKVIVKVSTPTTRQGYIFREYERSDKRRFYVPCPKCNHYQVLVFAQVRWPEGERDPENIQTDNLAWYECVRCKHHIQNIEKSRMLAQGIWLAEGQKIKADGTITKKKHHTHRAGFWINALYSPWLTWSEVAAEFLRSKDYTELLMNFVNSWLAEIWEEKSEETKVEMLEQKKQPYMRGTVPSGAKILTAGVDVQKDHLYFVIRAWGIREESWLIREGRVENFDALTEVLFSNTYPPAGNRGEPLAVRLACIDSAYRTEEVYDYCRLHHPEAKAVRGQDKLKAPWVASKIDYHPMTGGRIAGGIILWHIDSNYFKDKIHRLVGITPGDPGEWHLHSETTIEYLKQFCAEHKILIRDRRTGKTREEWQTITAGTPNHLFDCEVYAAAAADMLGVRYLKEETVETKIIQPKRRSGGWIQGGRGKSEGYRRGESRWLKR